MPLLALDQPDAEAAASVLAALPAEDWRPFNLVVADARAALHVRFDCADRYAWGTLVQRDDPLWQEETVEVRNMAEIQSAMSFDVAVFEHTTMKTGGTPMPASDQRP